MRRRIGLYMVGAWLLGWLSSVQGAEIAIHNNSNGSTIDQGLWWLYQLQYDKARSLFSLYMTSNPSDPAGYFYNTAADWWQLTQEYDEYLPDIQQRMEEDYQATLRAAIALLESSEDPKTKGLACFYAGGAQGLKGRWQAVQGQWVRAYFSGKSGHRYLKRALAYDPTLYDAYLGLGIYDYYADTLPGAQGVLAALLIHGDRKRGLQELQWAIEKGRRAVVEAKLFLIEIYTWEEHAPDKALPLAQELHQQFPESPVMHLAEIMDLYELNQWDALTVQALDFLRKSQHQVPYYQYAGIRPARYLLGVAALFGKHDPETCRTYMDQIIREGDNASRWVSFAYLRLAQVYDLKGDRPKALECYRRALERPNVWGSHREARLYLGNPFTFASATVSSK